MAHGEAQQIIESNDPSSLSLAGFTNGLDKIVRRISRGMNYIGMGSLLLLMLLTVSDVLLRFFFNKPILGSLELSEFIMVTVSFMVLPEMVIGGKDIGVDALTSRLSVSAKAILQSVTTFISLGLWSLVTWRLVVQALNVMNKGDLSENLNIPVYLFIFLAAFGSAVLSLVLFRSFLFSFSKARSHSGAKGVSIVFISIILVILFTAAIWLDWLPLGINPLTIGLIGIVFLLVFLASGMPIIFLLGILGFWGFSYINGVESGLGVLGTALYRTGSDYNFTVIPLFLLMGALCFASGLSQSLYSAAYRWLGHLPGGLAMATIGACAGFAAVSGSSVACAVTMGTVALPEMKKYKYDNALATGAIAAGGTLGILIPPSAGFVIYGIVTNQSIGKLFIAGIIPGIVQAILFIITIYVMCKHNPNLGPKGPTTSLKEKIVSLKGTWLVLTLFLLVIGGMYLGVFTATEAAGIGASGALFFALVTKKLTWKSFKSSMVETSEDTGMAIGILITAVVLGYFFAVTRLPFELANIVTGLDLPRTFILAIILLIYLVLGCLMPAIPMIVLTVPIFYPLVMALGYDPIWFGVIIVIMMELAQITPPVGINVFVIHGMAKDIPMYTVFKGVMPFVIADIIEIAILIAVPEIILFLPNIMT